MSAISSRTLEDLKFHLGGSDQWILTRRLLCRPLKRKALSAVVLYSCPSLKSLKISQGPKSQDIEHLLEHIVEDDGPTERVACEEWQNHRKDTKGALLWFAKLVKGAKRITRRTVWVY